MAPFTSINTREVSRDILSASSRPTSNGEAGPRVVKNKAKNFATQGSAPWDDDQRQQLVDYHARFETWEEVAKKSNRSNQAIRLEWKKMRDGKRHQGKQGHWQQNVEACEKQRETSFPSKGSRARNTPATAPTVGSPKKDSSTTPCAVASTSRSPAAETSSNTTLSMSPEPKNGGNTVPVGERSVEHEISTSHERTDLSQKEMRLDVVRQEIADELKYNTSIDITNTDMTGMDQTDTRDKDVIAEAMRYQSLGSVIKGIEPHESRMLFREEAWTKFRRRRVAYLHPWGFPKRWRGRGQWFPDVDLEHPDQISESCTRLSKREIAADLRKMGIGL
ncbi:hypothetical protein KCU77_g3857, partial [Aureobasidium melanogenum]